MKKSLVFMIASLVIILGGVWFYFQKPGGKPVFTPQSQRSTMQLTSDAFANNQPIPAKYTCNGENSSPPLTIDDVPQAAKSLVLIMDDPDAPSGDWVHWTMWNISPATTAMAENTPPPGAIEGTTSFGKPGYGGPCPPSGVHHYQFELYALDTELNLDSSAIKADLESAMKNHIIDQALLVGTYTHGK